MFYRVKSFKKNIAVFPLIHIAKWIKTVMSQWSKHPFRVQDLSLRTLGSVLDADSSPLLCLLTRSCGKLVEVSLVTLRDPGRALFEPV